MIAITGAFAVPRSSNYLDSFVGTNIRMTRASTCKMLIQGISNQPIFQMPDMIETSEIYT
jgi:hypothetical protein